MLRQLHIASFSRWADELIAFNRRKAVDQLHHPSYECQVCFFNFCRSKPVPCLNHASQNSGWINLQISISYSFILEHKSIYTHTSKISKMISYRIICVADLLTPGPIQSLCSTSIKFPAKLQDKWAQPRVAHGVASVTVYSCMHQTKLQYFTNLDPLEIRGISLDQLAFLGAQVVFQVAIIFCPDGCCCHPLPCQKKTEIPRSTARLSAERQAIRRNFSSWASPHDPPKHVIFSLVAEPTSGSTTFGSGKLQKTTHSDHPIYRIWW